jgi:hypothetical protein
MHNLDSKIGTILTTARNCAIMLGIYPITEVTVANRNVRLLSQDTKTYQTVQEALDDLEKEKAMLGLEGLMIMIGFDNSESAHSTSRSVGNLSLFNTVYLGKLRNRKALRHELYHIAQTKKYGQSSIIRDLKLFFKIEEWQATSYAVQND